jgi:very-short-patch-repair endonuclease
VREKVPLDAQISLVADRQHGHVTREQLLGLGLSARAVAARQHAGRLIRVHAGVYAVGAPRRTALARAAAAVLACGPQAALSHESALALWGLRDWPRIPEVTAPTEKRRPGIKTHRSTTLAGDVRAHQGIRTTSPARTMVDIAPRRTDRQLIRLVQDARLGHHLNDTALRRLLRRCPRLQALVDPRQRPTRSTLEDDFVAWLTHHELPMPQLNATVNGKEVDALYAKERLIIELDSWTYHGDRRAFNNDHRRDSDHRTLGYDTIRYTGELLTDAEAVNLRRRLSRSSAC